MLDIGCGSALYKKILQEDISYVGLELDTNRNPDVVGNALELPFESACFDNLICLEVLEHLPEPEKALKEMVRVAKPGARLLLSTPMSWYLHYEPLDFYRFTKYGLKYLFEKVGFQIIYIEPTGGFWTIVISRALETIFHLFYKFTLPIKWVTGKNKGRWRLAIMLLLPATLLGMLMRKVMDTSGSIFIQGWVILAEKV